MLLVVAIAIASPRQVPSCAEVRRALQEGGVQLEDEDLYKRSLSLGCRPAAAALGTIGTASARRFLASRPSYLHLYGMVHDETAEGLDALLVLATDPDNMHEVARYLTDEHPLADMLFPMFESKGVARDAARPPLPSPDGSWLLDGRTVRSAASGELVAELPEPLPAAFWSPDGSLLVGTTAIDWSTWFVWPAEGRAREVRTLFMPGPGFSFAGDVVVSQFGTRYDARTGALLDEQGPWSPQATGPDWRLSTSPHGIARFSKDGREPVYLEPQLPPFPQGLDHIPRPVSGAASGDGTHAAIMYDNGQFAVYDLRSSSPAIEQGWPAMAPIAWQSQAGWAKQCDDFIAVGKLAKRAEPMDNVGRRTPVADVLISPSGNALATVGTHGEQSDVVQLWDLTSGEVWQRTGFDAKVVLEGFERDGHLQVSAGPHVYRMLPSPRARPPQKVAASDRPPIDHTLQPVRRVERKCRDLEVIVEGKREVRKFDENGHPCPE